MKKIVFAVPNTLLPLLILFALLPPADSNDIHLGQGIQVGQSWMSDRGTFAVGFRQQFDRDNGFLLQIWYAIHPETIVWTAQSLDDDNQPLLVTSDAVLLLTNDALVVNLGLRTVWKTVIISCDQCIASGRMSDTGNLVMLDRDSATLWQSFDSPTDTLLPGQQLTGSMTLASGKYTLELDPMRAMLRYREYPTQPYWSITNTNLSVANFSSLDILPRLNLSGDGIVTFYDGTGNPWDNSLDDRSVRYALDHGSSDVVARLLRLESSGSLEMLSLTRNSRSWTTVWKAVFMECDIFGACGEFGICSYRPHRSCTCPPGFHPINSSDPAAGCEYDHELQCDAADNKFVRLVRADYPWNDYNFDEKIVLSMEGCLESCLRDCKCLAAAYKYQGTDLCFHKGNAGKLFNGIQTEFQENFVLLKVSGRSQVDGFDYKEFQDNSDGFVTDTKSRIGLLLRGHGSNKDKVRYHALLGAAIAEGIFIILAMAAVWMISATYFKRK